MSLSTHVLDSVTGRPCVGIRVNLDHVVGGAWTGYGRAVTDAEGRVRDWGNRAGLGPGRCRLTFDIGRYFKRHGIESLYPEIIVHVVHPGGQGHLHLPLLLAPNSYTTYRGC